MNKLERLYRRDLTYHELFEGVDYPIYCESCCEVIFGPAYVGTVYGYFVGLHKSCAELPDEIQSPLHPQHPLTAVRTKSLVVVDAALEGFICDGCRHYSWGLRYCCEKCDFNVDVRCISKLESQQLALKEKTEREFAFHEHKLQRFYHQMHLSTQIFRDIVCCCCSKGFQGSAYTCTECMLFIHEDCVDKFPQQVIRNPFHLKHELRYRLSFHAFECFACGQQIYGPMLGCDCQESFCSFHISCCMHAASGLRVKHHRQHLMLSVCRPYETSWIKMINCVVCNTACEKCATYSCRDCQVYVHIECIPLPRVVKHECHPYHALTLSDSTHAPKIASSEYWCVVCEKEGDLKHPFYYCEECPDIAHVDCVLSEEDSPSEILEYLIPRDIYKSDQDNEVEQQNDTDKNYKKSEEGKDKVPESDHKKEGKTELENSSLAEIDENIEAVKKKMDRLAEELGILATELKVLQAVRAQKLNSLS